jgi:predicted DNA binding CopG/RHH family protein
MKTLEKNKVFKSEAEERKFWDAHSPLDYFNVQNARPAAFPNLKPTLRSVSIRLPEDMLDELKILANKRDVPYQSLAKLYLSWGILAERRSLKAKA